MDDSFLLGIDGGGTKTVALLAQVTTDADFDVIGRGKAGSSNVRAVGWDESLSNLEIAIDQAWRSAGKVRAPSIYAVFALSGAGQESVRTRFLDWAHANRVAEDSRVIHDAEAVLRAGLPGSSGVALIAGTGSVAFALDQHGKSTVSGGWGYWFGDEGSAFWLGQSALRAVSQAADSRAPHTSLEEAILKRLGIDEPRSILQALSTNSYVRHGIASLADLVVAEAEEGDEVAKSIVTAGAGELAKLVESAVKAGSLETPFHLAMAGGVLCKSPLISAAVESELAGMGISPESVAVVDEPALGALQMAHQLSGT